MKAAPTTIKDSNVILITGNMAAGKSTVAQALAERLHKSVHLRGDVFRRMIVRAQAEMTTVLSDEAQQQLRLRYDLAMMTAKRYVQAGFKVVYQDIVIGPALDALVRAFDPMEVAVIVLCPRADVLAMRDQSRGKTGYRDRASVDVFNQFLLVDTPRIGLWLDNSDMTVSQTVDKILAYLENACAARVDWGDAGTST